MERKFQSCTSLLLCEGDNITDCLNKWLAMRKVFHVIMFSQTTRCTPQSMLLDFLLRHCRHSHNHHAPREIFSWFVVHCFFVVLKGCLSWKDAHRAIVWWIQKGAALSSYLQQWCIWGHVDNATASSSASNLSDTDISPLSDVTMWAFGTIIEWIKPDEVMLTWQSYYIVHGYMWTIIQSFQVSLQTALNVIVLYDASKYQYGKIESRRTDVRQMASKYFGLLLLLMYNPWEGPQTTQTKKEKEKYLPWKWTFSCIRLSPPLVVPNLFSKIGNAFVYFIAWTKIVQ